MVIVNSKDMYLQKNKETLEDFNGTGVAMLFSAGTFLYVATVHILPELAAMRSSQKLTSADGSVTSRDPAGFSKCELLLLVTGALLPLVLSVGHHH